jgi:signal transduction histidine kinase
MREYNVRWCCWAEAIVLGVPVNRAGLFFFCAEKIVRKISHPSTRAGGLGLVSMEERLRMIGGDLKVTTRLGEGTQFTAELCVAENA